MKKLCFIIAVLAVSVNSSADDNAGFREKEKKFIKELYRSGRYFDCIGETAKLAGSVKKPETEYFIYSNYYLAGQYTTVINNYTPGSSSDEMRFHSLLLLSGSFLKKGMYDKSYQTLKSIDYGTLADKYNFTMFLRRVEPLVLSGEMEMIDQEIAGSGIFLKDSYNFIKLRGELLSYRNRGLKSPCFAAALSAVLPGLGQSYAGYHLEGLISLLSVAATAAGGFYMKDAGRKGFSCTLFCFSGLFYAGNIYGAYNSASAANNTIMKESHRRITSQFGSYSPADYIDFERVFN